MLSIKSNLLCLIRRDLLNKIFVYSCLTINIIYSDRRSIEWRVRFTGLPLTQFFVSCFSFLKLIILKCHAWLYANRNNKENYQNLTLFNKEKRRYILYSYSEKRLKGTAHIYANSPFKFQFFSILSPVSPPVVRI